MLTSRRAGRWIATVVLALAAASFGSAGAASTGPCTAIKRTGPWDTIQGPVFPGGSREMSGFTVHPTRPSILFATDGRTVMRSGNGGCSWDESFSVGLLPTLEMPVAGAIAQIRSIEVPESPRGGEQVALLVTEATGPALRPHIVWSSDGGVSWELRDEGLPDLVSTPIALEIAPSDPDSAYLLTGNAQGGGLLLSSNDAGRSWQERADVHPVAGFAIDDHDPSGLWFWGPFGVHRSRDGGRTIAETAHNGTVNLGDVYQAPGTQARFMGYELETQTVVILYGDGGTFTRIGGPLQFGLSFASGRDPDDLVFGTRGQIYRFSAPQYWLSITPQGFDGDLVEVQIDRSSDQRAWGRTATTIMAYSGLDTEVQVDGFGLTPPPLDLREADLSGGERVVKLDPGERREISYRLTLPGEDTALDVFFLMDTTKSMQPSIAGLRAGMQRIADHLASTGIDVKFGVGDYKDYPIAGYGEPLNGDYPYRLGRGMGAADNSLADALASLEASGGGDLPESQLTALDQAVTGRGEPGMVDAGTDAGFRPGALPVIVHTTDAGFNDSPAHPSPPSGAVAAILNERGVKQIGLAVYGPDGPWKAEDSLRAMAEMTGTVAPPGGVDCDGRGGIDIPEGGPLMCRIEDESAEGVLNLAPAIIATLDALTKPEKAAVQPAEDSPVVAEVQAPVTVDLLHETGRDLKITYVCPRDLAGSRHEVEIVGTVAGRRIGAVTTEVRCARSPSPAAPLPPALAAVSPVGPIAAIAAAPPGPPPTIAEHAPAPQANMQSQPGFATQEEEQPQVAVADAGDAEGEEQLLFSAYRPRSAPEPSPAPLYAAALVVCISGATALSYRLRRAEEGSRSPRRPT